MLKLNPLFSDHAVLQRDVPVPVWGWSDPETRVEVRISNICRLCEVSEDGSFRVVLPPHPAGGPFEMTVKNRITGELCHFSDIFYGELWLASGQSNMEFTLDRNIPPAEHGDESVRMITVPHCFNPAGRNTFVADWMRTDEKKNFPRVSAAAYFFAEKLAAALGVHVGVINSSVGGSNIFSWISREALQYSPKYSAVLNEYESLLGREDFSDLIAGPYGQQEADWLRDWMAQHPIGPEEPGSSCWHLPEYDDSDWKSAAMPAYWNSFDERVTGIYYFRRTIEIPADWEGKNLLLSLGAADKHDITFFNGKEIGRTGTGVQECFWNAVRRYEIPGELVHAGKAVIAVRIHSFVNDGGFGGPAERMFLTDGSGRIVLSGDWKYRRSLTQPSPIRPSFSSSPVKDYSRVPYFVLPHHLPEVLFANMIKPLIPAAIRGVIWYQGEHNTCCHPEEYADMMEMLVNDWRRRWGMPEMPFHQMELAGFYPVSAFQENSNWALIRSRQQEAAVRIGSDSVPAHDIGDAADIHFPEKRPAGYRFTQTVLAEDYQLEPYGSSLKITEVSVKAGKIILLTDYTDELSVSKGETLFRIASADGVYYPADFHLESRSIIVDVPAVCGEPAVLRFAWSDNPCGAQICMANGGVLAPFEIRLKE